MVTRSVTCALLNGVGDVFSQLVVEQQELSVRRAATFTLLVRTPHCMSHGRLSPVDLHIELKRRWNAVR